MEKGQSVRHRRDEVAAIQAILNDDTFENDEDMAKALIAKVYELFKLRSWFGLKWGRYAYGPYIDKGEANRHAGLLEALPTVHPLLSVADLDRVIQQAMNPKIRRTCEACGHPAFAHGFSNHLGCVVRRPVPCPCKLSFR